MLPAVVKGCTATTNPPCVWSVADVVVRLTASNATQASITICRKYSTAGRFVETRATCMAKIDADCNGKVNTTDPACVALMRTAAPKTAAVPLIPRAEVKPPGQAAGAAGNAAAQPGAGRKLAAQPTADGVEQPSSVQGEALLANTAEPNPDEREGPLPGQPGNRGPRDA